MHASYCIESSKIVLKYKSIDKVIFKFNNFKESIA